MDKGRRDSGIQDMGRLDMGTQDMGALDMESLDLETQEMEPREIGRNGEHNDPVMNQLWVAREVILNVRPVGMTWDRSSKELRETSFGKRVRMKVDR